MAWWMTIEVLDGEFSSAASWKRAHGDALTEAAVTNGATSWNWHVQSWGVVLELRFRHDHQWTVFRALPAVDAALDAVPDRDGLLIYRGRGGSAGQTAPRPPRPLRGSGARALPEPVGDEGSCSRAPLVASGLCVAGGVPPSPSR